VSQEVLPMDVSESRGAKEGLAIRPGEMRLRRPVRNQGEMIVRDLDSLVAEDHSVRAVWAFLEGLDLSAFYASLKTSIDSPGRPASDPMVLLALWVYATAEGVGSARELDRLSQEHDAYRWLRGGVPVDYHLLADFRVGHRQALDGLLTSIIASLMANNLVTLKKVSHDGVRVRASAGAGSFHRRSHLEQCLTEAEEQVERLAKEEGHADPQASQREQVARDRAARERANRIRLALEQLPSIEKAKKSQQRTLSKPKRKKIAEARVSSTDAESRVMKMPDGGWRPAYNVQLATDVGSGVIVGADVVNQGSDAGQAPPMEEQVARRSGVHPGAYLIDGGFAQRDSIATLDDRQVIVYAPVRPPRTVTSGRESSTPRGDDSPAVRAWRKRMESPEAKALYKMRAATSEWANAQVRSHGLTPFTVRGIHKVLSIVLLVASAHNILRAIALAS
jgi:transposase